MMKQNKLRIPNTIQGLEAEFDKTEGPKERGKTRRHSTAAQDIAFFLVAGVACVLLVGLASAIVRLFT